MAGTQTPGTLLVAPFSTSPTLVRVLTRGLEYTHSRLLQVTPVHSGASPQIGYPDSNLPLLVIAISFLFMTAAQARTKDAFYAPMWTCGHVGTLFTVQLRLAVGDWNLTSAVPSLIRFLFSISIEITHTAGSIERIATLKHNAGGLHISHPIRI